MAKPADKAAMSEGAPADIGAPAGPLADGCRYTVVVPGGQTPLVAHHPAAGLEDVRRLLQEHGRGWAHDHETGRRLRLEDLR